MNPADEPVVPRKNERNEALRDATPAVTTQKESEIIAERRADDCARNHPSERQVPEVQAHVGRKDARPRMEEGDEGRPPRRGLAEGHEEGDGSVTEGDLWANALRTTIDLKALGPRSVTAEMHEGSGPDWCTLPSKAGAAQGVGSSGWRRRFPPC